MKKLFCILMAAMLLAGCQSGTSQETVTPTQDTGPQQVGDNVFIAQNSDLFGLLEQACTDGKFQDVYDNTEDEGIDSAYIFKGCESQFGQMKVEYNYFGINNEGEYQFIVGDSAVGFPTTSVTFRLAGDKVSAEVSVSKDSEWLYSYEPNIVNGKVTACYANSDTDDDTCSDEIIALAKENMSTASTMVKQALDIIDIKPSGMSFYPEVDISEYTDDVKFTWSQESPIEALRDYLKNFAEYSSSTSSDTDSVRFNDGEYSYAMYTRKDESGSLFAVRRYPDTYANPEDISVTFSTSGQLLELQSTVEEPLVTCVQIVADSSLSCFAWTDDESLVKDQEAMGYEKTKAFFTTIKGWFDEAGVNFNDYFSVDNILE